MSIRSTLAPGKPVPPEVEAYLKRYRPQWPEEHLELWRGPVGAAVVRWVRYAGPPTPDVARVLLTPVGSFALWSHLTRGSIDEEELWKPQVVDQWVHVVNASKSKAWKQTARAQLRRVGPLIGTKGGWPAIEVSSSRRGRSTPYTDAEESAFRLSALNAHGPTRARKLLVVACSFGAGLVGQRLANLQGDDVVEVAGGRLALALSSPSALVPVRSSYTDLLREGVSALGPGRLFPDSRNAVSRVTASVSVAGLGTLKIRRARVTWLLHHIANETPLPTLWEIAAPLSGSTIDELMRFVSGGDERGWTKALGA